MINPGFTKLQSYPFERLAQLIQGITPSTSKLPITLSIGEPKHTTPRFIIEAASNHLQEGLSIYPATRGATNLRKTIASWLAQRFHLPIETIDPERHAIFYLSMELVKRSLQLLTAL